MDRVVIVGASAAGLGAAEALRREGYSGSITLVGDEIHLPYDRPPLSKQLLKGTWTADKVQLRGPEQLDALAVDLALGSPAVGLDLATRTVRLENTSVLPFDGLVIATGVRPRQLTFPGTGAAPLTIRGLDDALALRAALAGARSIAVIGSGFLGAETAAVACELGLEVHLIDVLPAPMMAALGPLVGRRFAELHIGKGVTLHMGSLVSGLEGGPLGTVVSLDSGESVTADVVVAAVGSLPNTEWLRGSGLDLDDGVRCDEFCFAAPCVVAAGDVARWYHPGLGRYVRVEHRMNATEQSMAAARNLVGHRAAFAPVPYFWTDQFDVKVQAYGQCRGDHTFELVEGDVGSHQFAGLYRDRDRVVGALTWNMPKAARELRQAVLQGFAAATS